MSADLALQTRGVGTFDLILLHPDSLLLDQCSDLYHLLCDDQDQIIPYWCGQSDSSSRMGPDSTSSPPLVGSLFVPENKGSFDARRSDKSV